MQHTVNCRLARAVVVPEVIPPERLYPYGATDGKLRRYEGLKEEYYLADFEPDRAVLDELGLDADEPLAVVRTPPDVSLYHRFENDVFARLLDRLQRRADRRPAPHAGPARGAGQRRRLHRARARDRRAQPGGLRRPGRLGRRYHEPRGGCARHARLHDVRGQAGRGRRAAARARAGCAGSTTRTAVRVEKRSGPAAERVRRDPQILVDLLPVDMRTRLATSVTATAPAPGADRLLPDRARVVRWRSCCASTTRCPQRYEELLWQSVAFVIAGKLLFFSASGLYSKLWRFVDARDFEAIVRAVVLSTFALVVVFFLLPPSVAVDPPRGVIAADFLLTLGLVGGSRFFVRSVKERPLRGALAHRDSREVLIVGAGNGGQLVAAELRRNPELRQVADRLRRRRPAQAGHAHRRPQGAGHDRRAAARAGRRRARRGDHRDPVRPRRRCARRS